MRLKNIFDEFRQLIMSGVNDNETNFALPLVHFYSTQKPAMIVLLQYFVVTEIDNSNSSKITEQLLDVH